MISLHLKFPLVCMLLMLWLFNPSQGKIQGCRPEDGLFQCKDGSGCILREYVLDNEASCDDGSDQISLLNCTDDELRGRFFGRCIKILLSVPEFSLHNLCSDREFVCINSKVCIERWKVMDGSTEDCNIAISDKSDEEAPLPFCFPEEFSCSGDNANNTLQCIPREWVGDGYVDCLHSGLDENVTLRECFNDTEFRCESGRCIPRYRVKDQYQDCRNDETTTLDCYEDFEFKCNDTGRCIPRAWLGNNIKNCPDGSDEIPPSSGEECKQDEVLCHNKRRCIPKTYLCDGIDQCGDCSDEIENCENPRMFRCHNDNQKCIHWEHSCDAVIDCYNNEDDITSIAGFKCYKNLLGSNQKRYCVVPQWSLNDDIPLCDDKSDICFNNGSFMCTRCLDNTIIAPGQLCDDIIDCPDLSDECLCEKVIDGTRRTKLLCDNVCYGDQTLPCDICKVGDVYCPDEGVCIQSKQVCDGKMDCFPSGFDEMFCSKVFEEQSSVSNQSFECDHIPSYVKDIFDHFNLQGMATLVRNSKTAKRCDGLVECLYFEDECSERANCSERLTVCDSIPIVKTDVSSWKIGLFWDNVFQFSDHGIESLESRRCEVPFEFVIGKSICNGIQECESKRDEKECPHRFKCDAGTAAGFSYKPLPVVSIPAESVCDGIIDCVNGEDEMGCSESTHFYCESGDTPFVLRSQVINGKADCDDRSDECPESYLSDSAISSNKFLIVSTALEFFLWMMAIFALTGNGAVISKTTMFIFSAHRKGPLQKPAPSAMINKLLIFNLAVADFLMGVALLTIIIKTRQYSGDYCVQDKAWRTSSTCNGVGVITVLSSEVSVLTLVCLTSYRLYHILFPFKGREAKIYILIVWVIVIWITSVILAVVPLLRPFSLSMVRGMWIEDNRLFASDIVNFPILKQFIQRLTSFNGSQVPGQDIYKDWYSLENYLKGDSTGQAPVTRGYFGYYSASGLCIPRFYKTMSDDSDLNALSPAVITFNFVALLYIVLAYVLIYRRTTYQHPVAGHASDQQRKQAMFLQRKVTILIATDMICWLPICIMTFMSVGGIVLPEEAYAVSAIILLPINSSINPLIYTNALPAVWQRIYIVVGRVTDQVLQPGMLRPFEKPNNSNTSSIGHGSSASVESKQVPI